MFGRIKNLLTNKKNTRANKIIFVRRTEIFVRKPESSFEQKNLCANKQVFACRVKIFVKKSKFSYEQKMFVRIFEIFVRAEKHCTTNLRIPNIRLRTKSIVCVPGQKRGGVGIWLFSTSDYAYMMSSK